MADQGKVAIPMTVPGTGVMGNLVAGDGTFSATKRAAGVMLDDADGAVLGPVQISGTALVKLAETLSAGDLFIMDASGDAAAHTEDTDTVDGDDHLVCGILLEGGVVGNLVSAIIK